MQEMPIGLLTLKIKNSEDIVTARQRARQITTLLKFNQQSQTHLATVVSELARNAYQYASGGEVKFCINKEPEHPSLYVEIHDKGPGINNLNELLAGKQTKSEAHAINNLGITGSRKLVDNFTIHSSPDKGTNIIVELYLPKQILPITNQTLARIADELAKHRPKNVSEEVQQQNQELLHALALLAKARDELEERVRERTAQLTLSNQKLQLEIAERQRTQTWIQQHQQQLAQAERLNSMGEMASALAHELNQPLTGITTYTQGCIRRLKSQDYETDELLQVMERVAQQSERAGEIIHRMKNFVRQGELSIEKADINQLIEQTLILMEHELKKSRARIQFQKSQSLPSIWADTVQIQQVITNLIRNAIQAMAAAKTPKPIVTIKTGTMDETFVVLNVIDNGPGFACEDPQLLLQPYYTTKVKGMGMGLSISRTIIEAHHGQLLAKHASQGGACFQCLLPIAEV